MCNASSCFSNSLLVQGGRRSWEGRRRLERQLGQAVLQKTEAGVLGKQAKGVFHPLLGGDEPRGLAELYEPKHKLSCWNRLCADEKGKCMK